MASSLHKRRLHNREYRLEHERLYPSIRPYLTAMLHRDFAVDGAARRAINNALMRAAHPKVSPSTETILAAVTDAAEASRYRGRPGALDAEDILDWARKVTAPRMELAMIGKVAETQAAIQHAHGDLRTHLADRLRRLRIHQANLRSLTSSLSFARMDKALAAA